MFSSFLPLSLTRHSDPRFRSRYVFQHAVYLSFYKRRKAFTLDRRYGTNTANLYAVCQYLQRCRLSATDSPVYTLAWSKLGADNSLHTVIFTPLQDMGIICCCVLAAGVGLRAPSTKVGLLPTSGLLGRLLKCSRAQTSVSPTAKQSRAVYCAIPHSNPLK